MRCGAMVLTTRCGRRHAWRPKTDRKAQPSDGAGERGPLLDASSVETEMAPLPHASHHAPANESRSLSANRRLTGARRFDGADGCFDRRVRSGLVESARSERVSMMDADVNED